MQQQTRNQSFIAVKRGKITLQTAKLRGVPCKRVKVVDAALRGQKNR
jgi:hypothetical protein